MHYNRQKQQIVLDNPEEMNFIINEFIEEKVLCS